MGKAVFDRWLAAAEAQLIAARSVDAAAMNVATRARQEAQIEASRVQLAALSPAASTPWTLLGRSGSST